MRSTQYIIWEDDGRWYGHLQDHPDLLTQGESFEDLQTKLCRLHYDLASGNHDRCHNLPSSMPYPTPRRANTNARLERLLSTILNTP